MIIEDSNEILDRLAQFYKKLFTGVSSQLEDSFLQNVHLPQLTPEDRESLELKKFPGRG